MNLRRGMAAFTIICNNSNFDYSIKRISYSNRTDADEIHVLIEEVLLLHYSIPRPHLIYAYQVLDAAYGCYIWPSALVMGEFVWHQRDLFKNKTVLEVRVQIKGFVDAEYSMAQ